MAEENTKELSTLEEIKFAITKVGAGFKKIQKPLEYLENLEFDELQHHTMIARIKARDKLRGDNILKYFPEWKPYFKGAYYDKVSIRAKTE